MTPGVLQQLRIALDVMTDMIDPTDTLVCASPALCAHIAAEAGDKWVTTMLTEDLRATINQLTGLAMVGGVFGVAVCEVEWDSAQVGVSIMTGGFDLIGGLIEVEGRWTSYHIDHEGKAITHEVVESA